MDTNRAKFGTSVQPVISRFVTFIASIARFRFSQKSAEIMLNLVSKNGKTFRKKILIKMKYDRNPQLKILADKVSVRSFVEERIGSSYLTNCYGVYDNLHDLKREDFPRNIAVKSNHGSGAWVIIWEGAPRGVKFEKQSKRSAWSTYLIHPDDVAWDELITVTDNWLKQDYYWKFGRLPEWAYLGIKPRIIVEEVLISEMKLPVDLKFHMINGICKFIWVGKTRFTGLRIDLYSPEWIRLDGTLHYPNSGELTERPRYLEQMLTVSSKLSKGLDFVRVDLYETDQGIKFGEMTNYPFGGLSDIKPKNLSIELAKEWIQNYEQPILL